MNVFRIINQMREFVKEAKAKGKTIGFVPTMGYLHEGHLSLVRRALRESDCVIVSIFVNPTQFGPAEDLKKYPRDFKRDERMLRKVGVDAIFYPSASQMYPKTYQTYVDVEVLSKTLCGASRPRHFRGVATVVAKLFNIIKPDVAYFGQKDGQQALVIKAMAKDLNMDIMVKVLPIVREADGLAMSSRNKYLTKHERKDARILSQSLKEACHKISQGIKDPKKIITTIRRMINSKKSAKIDYIAIVDEELKPVKRVSPGNLIALAVRIGKTRLIDNVIVR